MAPRDDIMRLSPAMSESGELNALPRPMSNSLWNGLAVDVPDDWSYLPQFRSFMHARTDQMKRFTGLFSIVDALGLREAAWIDYILARPLDACAWLVAFSHYRRSSSMRLEAHPQFLQGSENAVEQPDANPWQMVLFQILGYSYGRNEGIAQRTVGRSFPVLLRDDHGHIFFLRMDITKRASFLLQAAQRCPEVLYSDASPFFPIYEVAGYSEAHEATIWITQTPPWPLVEVLAPRRSRDDELRRVLECARDLFAHLVTLQSYGISLDCPTLSDSWTYSFMRAEGGPWVLPAYLGRCQPNKGSQKMARMGCWEEKLPPMPGRAWPLTPLKSQSSRHALPWSQMAAYIDPRVEGPKIYIHGVNKASWQDETAAKRREDWPSTVHLPLLHGAVPRGRFHADLLAVAQYIFSLLASSCWIPAEELPKLLAAPALSAAYEAWYTTPLDCLPPAAPDCQRSGLFTACVECCLIGRVSIPPCSVDAAQRLAGGECPVCGSHRIINAIPASLQQLLHRIACPGQLQDGTVDVVTAQEASQVINAVIEVQIPRMQRVYERWADAQEDVTRLTRPAEARLPHILRDSSVNRWMMLEMLRGNYLDETLSREELKQMRDFIKNELSPVQKQKRDKFRAACGDVVEEENEAAVAEDVEGVVGEEQPPKRGRRSAAAAAAAPTGAGECSEAADAESSSSGAKKGAKRGGGSSSKGSATKKAKKKK